MRGGGLGDRGSGGMEEGRVWSFDLGFGIRKVGGREGRDDMLDLSRMLEKG